MSIFFNTPFYLLNNPDVRQAVANGTMESAEAHFNIFGFKEGRNPNATFDVNFYLSQYPDVQAAGVNPLQHFLQFGIFENRVPKENFVAADQFDAAAYAAVNPDLAAAGITSAAALYAHFATFGFAESRTGVQTVSGTPINNGIVVTVDDVVDTGGGGGGGSTVVEAVATTFSLTSGVDNFVGGSANDTFIAAQQATLAAGDSINGGGGTDRLNIFGSANADQFANTSVTNVEQVYAQFDGTGTLNVSANADVNQAWVSKGDVGTGARVTLTKAQTAGIEGTVAGSGRVTFAFSDASTATGDVASLALIDANTLAGGGVYNYDIETLNVSVTGTNVLGTATAFAARTVNVTGAGSLSATISGKFLTSVDASAATGAMTLTMTSSTSTQTFKTGSAGDTITTTYFGLSSADTIDLGTGVDALLFNENAIFNDTTTAARLSKVTNVEKLGTI